MRAMAEWYGKANQEGDTEHARLSRVLGIKFTYKIYKLCPKDVCNWIINFTNFFNKVYQIYQ